MILTKVYQVIFNTFVIQNTCGFHSIFTQIHLIVPVSGSIHYLVSTTLCPLHYFLWARAEFLSHSPVLQAQLFCSWKGSKEFPEFKLLPKDTQTDRH